MEKMAPPDESVSNSEPCDGTKTPVRNIAKRRSLGLSRSGGMMAFVSPKRANHGSVPTMTSAEIEERIEKVQKEMGEIQDDIDTLESKGYTEDLHRSYLAELHKYNDIKDACQKVIGRLAEIRGVTFKSIHEEYKLPLQDE